MSASNGSDYLQTRCGKLELLTALPSSPNGSPPLLFVHGSGCAAACFKNFLPLFSSRGYKCYALSLRGHGASWKMSWFWMMFFTTFDSFTDDVESAITHIKDENKGQAPVLVAHSLGGGIVQYMLSTRPEVKVPGVVLLASVPLMGRGPDILANWTAAEAPDGYDWPWSRRYRLDSVSYVRSAFFSKECDEKVIEWYMKECQPPSESVRATLGVSLPMGSAEKVLAAIEGLPKSGKKLLCVAGAEDALITMELVEANVKDYQDVDDKEGIVTKEVVSKSGHMVMLDVAYEECAELILKWLD